LTDHDIMLIRVDEPVRKYAFCFCRQNGKRSTFPETRLLHLSFSSEYRSWKSHGHHSGERWHHAYITCAAWKHTPRSRLVNWEEQAGSGVCCPHPQRFSGVLFSRGSSKGKLCLFCEEPSPFCDRFARPIRYAQIKPERRNVLR
jgi:hypothetical protein